MITVSIGQRLFIGFFILIALSTSFLLISFPSLTTINLLSSAVVPLSEDMDAIQRGSEKVRQLQNKIELFLTIRSEESQDEVVTALDDARRSAQEITAESSNSQLQKASELILGLTQATSALLEYLYDHESTYRVNVQIIAINKLFQEFEEAQKTLQHERLLRLKENVSRQQQIAAALLDRFLLIEISIVVFGLLASLFISRLITRNLSKLKQVTQQIAAGHFDSRIQVASRDEIGALAHSFNTMAEELQKKTVSKEYLDNIIGSMAETLVIADPDLTISRANNALCELLAYRQEELVGEPVRKIFALEKQELPLPQLEHQIRAGKLLNYQMYYHSSSGRLIPVLFSASAMEDERGALNCIICTASDITERMLAEEKIKEASEVKSKLTSMVSHELRTPMAAIKSGINVVLDGLAGEVNDEQKDILGIARKNVDRLARLINDVLDFQKLGAGKMEFDMQENDINEVVEESFRAMRPVAEGKGLSFERELISGLPRVRFDRDKIIQVVSNLVNNAIKFTERGKITINTQRVAGGIRVSVIDTGIGIKEKDIPKVFGSFEQLEKAGGGKYEGTGLGLAICKEIIEAHKGIIRVDSQYGSGSTFYFILPLQ